MNGDGTIDGSSVFGALVTTLILIIVHIKVSLIIQYLKLCNLNKKKKIV
jgi:hypothetical protein